MEHHLTSINPFINVLSQPDLKKYQKVCLFRFIAKTREAILIKLGKIIGYL